RRHTRCLSDWSSDVCSSDLRLLQAVRLRSQSLSQRDQKDWREVRRGMDTTVLAFLAAPFVASLILAGIHAYLGVHVVERGVIFEIGRASCRERGWGLVGGG